MLMPALVVILLSSCSTTGNLELTGVGYQSVNTLRPQPANNATIPEDATILASYAIDENGYLAVFIKNLSDRILVIDQEMSFFINPNGESVSYYDPTVRASTTTDYNSTTSGATVNLGAITSAFGVGGSLGTLLGGVNVGKSSTSGISNSNTVIVSDQKKVNIGPRGTVQLSKTFKIGGLGRKTTSAPPSVNKLSYKDSPITFKVCIYYSDDEGAHFEKLITDFYASTYTFIKKGNNEKINDTMRQIMISKPDLFGEPWYLMYIGNNIKEVIGDDFTMPMTYTHNIVFDNIIKGMLYDYK